MAKRRSYGLLDDDNAVGGLKYVLDALVTASPRNPSGIGLLVDDRRSLLQRVDVEQVQLKRGGDAQPGCTLAITGVFKAGPCSWSD